MAMTELGQLDVTYRGDEASQIFFEPVFFDEELLSSYRVMPNVTTRKKMQFAEKLEKIVRRYTGCGFNPVGGLNIYDRYVEVDKMKINIELCMDEFLDTVIEELLNTGTRLPDITGTQIESILINRVRQGLRLDIERIFHFGDRSSTDPNYDQMDGVWTVHYPALVAANLCPRYNTQSGSALSAGDGIDILRTVHDNAPNELKALPNNQKVFNVTGSIWLQLMEDYENAGGADGGFMLLREGQPTMNFRGIAIRPMWRWDDILNELGTPNAHYIEYTTPQNKVLATDVGGVNPGADLTMWYDQKEEKVYVKSLWKMGSNYVHPSLISVGY